MHTYIYMYIYRNLCFPYHIGLLFIWMYKTPKMDILPCLKRHIACEVYLHELFAFWECFYCREGDGHWLSRWLLGVALVYVVMIEARTLGFFEFSIHMKSTYEGKKKDNKKGTLWWLLASELSVYNNDSTLFPVSFTCDSSDVHCPVPDWLYM